MMKVDATVLALYWIKIGSDVKMRGVALRGVDVFKLGLWVAGISALKYSCLTG